MNEIVLKKKAFEAYMKDNPEKSSIEDDVVNVINIQHGTDEGTQYVHQWEQNKGRKAKGCANLNCDNHYSYDALQGAHVMIHGGKDRRWYITPLCHVCNRADNYDLMPVYREDLGLYTDIKDIEL